MKPRFRTAVALFVALTAASTAARQSTNVTPPAGAQAQRGSGGVQERLQLHGNWVLDVRNPDGTLVRHSEFKNALMATGQAGLAKLLGGQPFSTWVVSFNEAFLLSDTDALPGLCEGNLAGQCRVYQKDGPLAGVADQLGGFATMSVSAPANQLIMTGDFTATRGGQIQRVATHLQVQGAPLNYLFTMATLPTPLPVAQGQIVTFTYTLSFS